MKNQINKKATIVSLIILVLLTVLGVLIATQWNNLEIIVPIIAALIGAVPLTWIGLVTSKAISESALLKEGLQELHRIGIEQVSKVGRPSDGEMDELFSKCKTVKICVIAGSMFLTIHRPAIEDALKKGADIQILMARAGSEFLNDLTTELKAVAHKKDDKFFDVTQAEEIIKAKAIVDSIRKDLGIDNAGKGLCKGKIEIRQYNSEYRTKFILGFTKGEDTEKGKIKCYYNMALPVRAPAEYPLFIGSVNAALRDEYLALNSEKENFGSKERNYTNLHFIFDLDLHFNYLWDKYAPSKE